MPMQLDYDPAENILYATYIDINLSNAEEVRQFYQELTTKFKQIGRRCFLVANMAGLMIDVRQSEAYAEGLKELAQNYILASFRYNLPEGFPRLAIRLAAAKANMPSNLFNSREEALEALRKFRSPY